MLGPLLSIIEAGNRFVWYNYLARKRGSKIGDSILYMAGAMSRLGSLQ
jgi:hypothetical protein